MRGRESITDSLRQTERVGETESVSEGGRERQRGSVRGKEIVCHRQT